MHARLRRDLPLHLPRQGRGLGLASLEGELLAREPGRLGPQLPQLRVGVLRLEAERLRGVQGRLGRLGAAGGRGGEPLALRELRREARGLARVLRVAAPSALPFLEEIATNLSGMAAEDSPRARRVAAMAADARRVLNAERAAALAERGSVAAARGGARRAKPRTGEPPAPSGGIRKRPARRDLLP